MGCSPVLRQTFSSSFNSIVIQYFTTDAFRSRYHSEALMPMAATAMKRLATANAFEGGKNRVMKHETANMHCKHNQEVLNNHNIL